MKRNTKYFKNIISNQSDYFYKVDVDILYGDYKAILDYAWEMELCNINHDSIYDKVSCRGYYINVNDKVSCRGYSSNIIVPRLFEYLEKYKDCSNIVYS